MLRALLVMMTAVGLTGCGDRFARNLGQAGHTIVNFGSERDANEVMNLMEPFLSMERVLDSVLGPLGTVGAGLIVYAENADNPMYGGQRAFAAPGDANGANWAIPNGRYRFFVLGYNASSSGAVTGMPGCGVANGGAPFELRGGEQVVRINTGSCNQPPFIAAGTPSGGSVSSLFEVKLCTETDVSGVTYAGGCTTPLSGSNSMIISYVSYDHFGTDEGPPLGVSATIHSPCVDHIGSGTYDFDAAGFFPMQGPGRPEFRFATSLQIINAPSCAGSTLARFHFPAGLGAAGNGLGAMAVRHHTLGLVPERAKWTYDVATNSGRLHVAP